jgi:CHAT domain-containing protein
MNEERRKAYLNLINALLNCPSGEEPKILNAQPNLVDKELMQMMGQMAAVMAAKGDQNTADCLIYLAHQVAAALGLSSSKPTAFSLTNPKSQLLFLMQVLQVTAGNPNPRVVYPLLQANIDKLDDNFAQVLRNWAAATLLNIDQPAKAENLAEVIGNFSNLISDLPSNRASNLEIAIAGYEIVADILSREASPELWATLQHNLGTAYSERIRGERADNLEQAIKCYQQALLVRTRDRFLEEWADTQNNLGNVYINRIREERAENLEAAIGCFSSVLDVFTHDSFPEKWAMIHNNLGPAYFYRILGNKADNLEQTIKCYNQALLIYSREDFPQPWAGTKNNLGNAYLSRILRNRTNNIERAIWCYRQGLLVYTRDTFPEDWADTQVCLGNAYSQRIQGERADNLNQSIEFYQQGLLEFTPDAFPEKWAHTQHNLGVAYSNLSSLQGDRTRGNFLNQAIRAFTEVLRIMTRETFPQNYAETQFNLGLAYQKNHQLLLAYDSFADAIDTIESLRGEIVSGSGNEQAKQKLAEQWNYLYQSMVIVCLRLGKPSEAIEYVERSKARNLVELLANKDLCPKRALYPNQNTYQAHCDQVNRLRREIPAKQRELETLTSSWESEERYRDEIERQRQELNHLKQQQDELLGKINQVDSSFTFTQKVEPIPFRDIQALIDENTAIVEWYITGSQILTFIITHHTHHPIIVPSSPEDMSALEDWDKEYRDAYPQQKSQWITNLASRLQHLAEIVHIDDILSRIDDIFKQKGARCDRLILIPHRYLHLFPLHALPLANGDFLCDRFPNGVGYAPSCQLLQLAQRREQHRHHFSRLLAIENPTRSNLSPLAGTKLQLEQICQHFDSDHSIVLREQEATEAALLNEQMRSPHCVHFCCHGSFNFGSPLKSALHLADPDSKLGADADLTLGKIFAKLNLEQCRLVTFSACETGIADPTSISDEYISLVSGFLYAGSPSVVSTLWAVQQAATNLFMIEFYKNLKQLLPLKPGSVAIALNKTQKWLRTLTGEELGKIIESPEFQRHLANAPENAQNKLFKELLEAAKRKPFPYQNPYYWAAFVATGL